VRMRGSDCERLSPFARRVADHIQTA